MLADKVFESHLMPYPTTKVVVKLHDGNDKQVESYTSVQSVYEHKLKTCCSVSLVLYSCRPPTQRWPMHSKRKYQFNSSIDLSIKKMMQFIY